MTPTPDQITNAQQNLTTLYGFLTDVQSDFTASTMPNVTSLLTQNQKDPGQALAEAIMDIVFDLAAVGAAGAGLAGAGPIAGIINTLWGIALKGNPPDLQGQLREYQLRIFNNLDAARTQISITESDVTKFWDTQFVNPITKSKVAFSVFGTKGYVPAKGGPTLENYNKMREAYRRALDIATWNHFLILDYQVGSWGGIGLKGIAHGVCETPGGWQGNPSGRLQAFVNSNPTNYCQVFPKQDAGCGKFTWPYYYFSLGLKGAVCKHPASNQMASYLFIDDGFGETLNPNGLVMRADVFLNKGIWKNLTFGGAAAVLAEEAPSDPQDGSEPLLLPPPGCGGYFPCNTPLGMASALDRKPAALASGSLSGADLADSNLMMADLSDRDLTGATLAESHLTLATLERADLSGADLRSVWADEIHGAGATMADACLDGAELSGSDLRNATLTGASMVGCRLVAADLRDANLSGADLTGAILRSAQLDGAVLDDATLTGADLSRTSGYDAAIPGSEPSTTLEPTEMVEAAAVLAKAESLAHPLAISLGSRTEAVRALFDAPLEVRPHFLIPLTTGTDLELLVRGSGPVLHGQIQKALSMLGCPDDMVETFQSRGAETGHDRAGIIFSLTDDRTAPRAFLDGGVGHDHIAASLAAGSEARRLHREVTDLLNARLVHMWSVSAGDDGEVVESFLFRALAFDRKTQDRLSAITCASINPLGSVERYLSRTCVPCFVGVSATPTAIRPELLLDVPSRSALRFPFGHTLDDLGRARLERLAAFDPEHIWYTRIGEDQPRVQIYI